MADISYTPSIERLAQSFRTLPGVGKKSAYRMAFSVLDMPEEKAKAFIAEIYAMNERMNIPTGFTQIQEKDIPTIVERALKEGNPGYPVPVIFGKEEMTAIVKSLKISETANV